VSFAALTLCVASQLVFIVYFDSVRKLLDTPSYVQIYFSGTGSSHVTVVVFSA